MKAAVGALLLTATFAVPAAADIRVWTEKDRQGDGREIRRAVRDLRNYDFDDRISSLETDEPWEICTEPLYRGDCRVVQGVVLNLRVLGLNNRITSMRRASDEMITGTMNTRPVPTAPPKTQTTKAEPVPERSTTARTTTSPERTKAQAPRATETVKAEPVPEPSKPAERMKAQTLPPTETAKAEPVPEPAATATATARTTTPTQTTKPEPVPEPSATARTTSPTQTTKPEPIPEPSATARTTTPPETAPSTPEPVPEPSAQSEGQGAGEVPADAWRKVKPLPAPKPEPAPATQEWWQGGDETAGAPPTLDLFEKPNFEGKRVRLEQAISDVTALDQSVGSLLVRSGSWKICSKPQFRGRCRTVDASGMGVPETALIGSLRPETD